MSTASVTPNIGLQVPSTGSNNWQIPLNYDLNKLDQLLGGQIAIPNLLVTNLTVTNFGLNASDITNALGYVPVNPDSINSYSVMQNFNGGLSALSVQLQNITALDSSTSKIVIEHDTMLLLASSGVEIGSGLNCDEDVYIGGNLTVQGTATFQSSVTLAADPTTALEAATKQYVDTHSGSGAVSSVFGRTGAVVAVSGDYTASQITNAAATNAANTFATTQIAPTWKMSNGGSITDDNSNINVIPNGGTGEVRFNNSSQLVAPSNYALTWTSGNIFGSPDTGLSRISAGLIAVGNGTAADFSGSLKLTNLTIVGTATGITAAMVTNALDLSDTGLQTLSGNLHVPDLTSSGGIECTNLLTTNTLRCQSDAEFDSHILSATTAPTVVGGAGLGTGGTVSISGTDSRGSITLNTGTTPPVTSTYATVTFAKSYTTAPIVVASYGAWNGANMNSIQIAVTSVTTAGFVLGTGGGAALPASHNGIVINYIVIG